MKIVIVGAAERDTPTDKQQVEEVMERLTVLYPGCIFIALMTNKGVGKFVRDKCIEKDGNGRFRYQFIECSLRVYAPPMAKSDTAEIYIARNATPFELADILIYFASSRRRGTTEDLLDRMKKAGRLYKIFLPGESVSVEGM